MDVLKEIGILDIPEINNEEQARSWVEVLILDMQAWREACTIHIPNPTEEKVKQQQRAFWKFLQKQGKVMGALHTLLLMRKVNEVAYNELKQKALNALGPTVVGKV